MKLTSVKALLRFVTFGCVPLIENMYRMVKVIVRKANLRSDQTNCFLWRNLNIDVQKHPHRDIRQAAMASKKIEGQLTDSAASQAFNIPANIALQSTSSIIKDSG